MSENLPKKSEDPLSTHEHAGPLLAHNRHWTTKSLVRHVYFDGSYESKPFSHEVLLTLQAARHNHAIIISLRDETQEKIELQLDGEENNEYPSDLKALAARLRKLHIAPINQRRLALEIKDLRERISDLLWQTTADMCFMDR